MAGHQQGALELVDQPFLQPDDRFDVEVVGRLVEQQDIGVDGQDPGQGDAHLPAAAEGFDRPVEIVVREAETGEHRLGPGIEVIAAAMLEDLDDVAVALQQVGQFRHRPSARSSPPPSPASARPSLDDLAGCRHDLGEYGPAGHLADILGEIADDGLLGAGLISPRSTSSSPVIRRKIVVLPAPFGPTRPVRVSGRICRLAS